MNHRRSEHQKLAATIKGVHKHLRRQFRESDGDFEAVWEKHAHDDDRLKSYADAMKHLATDHWSEYPESRIDWCYQVIVEYFIQGGLQKVLERDAKHKFFESQRKKEACENDYYKYNRGQGNLKDTVSELNRCESSHDNVETVVGIDSSQELALKCTEESLGSSPWNESSHRPSDVPVLSCQPSVDGPTFKDSNHDQSSFPQNAHHSFKTNSSSSQIRPEDGSPSGTYHQPDTPPNIDVSSHPTPLQLLDVGSCYNPFRTYPDLDPVAVDLYPADSTVLQCDFLKLIITPSSNSIACQENKTHFKTDQCKSQSDILNHLQLPQLKSPVQQLPASSFDVVVFCLLLEYFPSPLQRAQCCTKAVRLLKLNGLLLIISPDSKSSHRNAPLMKSWRSALAMLGMTRWKYHKKQHLHCMAFRKVSESVVDIDNVSTTENQISQLLYIPQDFTDACYDDVVQPKTDHEQKDYQKTCQENEDFRSSVIEELPIFCDDFDF